MSGRSWTHRVIKRMRGADGEYFDFPTAGTFRSEASAREYAERFARAQGEARVCGAHIVVRARRGNRIVALYFAEDYVPPAPGRGRGSLIATLDDGRTVPNE